MKHVVITGGLGFIGHNLAKHYLKSGAKVTIIDNLIAQYNHAKVIKYRIEYLNNYSENCTYLQHDCCEEYTLWERLKETKPNSIIHLASYANQAAVRTSPVDAARTMPSNAAIVAQLANRFNCKLIHVSSSMVYGNFKSWPVNEDAPLEPINLYGILKKHTEEIVKHIRPLTTIIRPSAVYGPGDSSDRVLAKWIKAALRNDDIDVHGPANLLDFTYVKDLVDGIVRIESQDLEGRTYNVTRGQSRSLGEAAHLIKSYTNSSSKICYQGSVSDSPSRGALDIIAAKLDSGYKPKMDLEEGLKVYVQWMIDNYNLYD